MAKHKDMKGLSVLQGNDTNIEFPWGYWDKGK